MSETQTLPDVGVTYNLYQLFVDRLFDKTETVCFAHISEIDGKKNVGHGFITGADARDRDVFNQLLEYNKTANIYIGMNPFKDELRGQKVGRTEANVAKIKRLYADADANGRESYERLKTSTKLPKPHFVLESSPSKYQFIWNVEGLTQETAKRLLKAIAHDLGTDTAVTETARVLRIPGFANCKYPDRPLVKIIDHLDADPYRAEDFQVELKEADARPEITRNQRGLIPHGEIHHFMLSAAGELRDLGYGQDVIEMALREVVHKNCEPPIDDSKIKAMSVSICTYEPGEAGRALVLNLKPDAQPSVKTGEITPELLAKEFPAYDGQTPPKLPMLIDDFMPEGVTFFGSLAGTGKTWMGLSVTKALTTGSPLWGVFHVSQISAVLYLIPEASDFSFKARLKKMGITQDKTLFRYRTISQGMTKPLQDPLVLAMVKELAANGRKVLIVVDTAVRFLQADDENSSMENSLVKDSEALRTLGASVLFMHHSPKASKEAAELTLENVLRGTGDFGAMADAVYGLRRDEALYGYGEGPEEMEVVCVKSRDMERSPLPFRVALSRKPKRDEGDEPVSVINETQDLGYIGNDSIKGANGNKLAAILRENPKISLNALHKELKIRKEAVKNLAARMGWRYCGRTAGWAHGLEMNQQPVADPNAVEQAA